MDDVDVLDVVVVLVELDEELEVDPMLHYRTVYFDDAKPAAEELEA